MNMQAETQAPGAPPSAAPPSSGPGSILGNPIFFAVAMILLTWALFLRPQQRREKEQKAMLSQVEKGDSIVTTGGVHGRVTGVTDDVLTVEIAPNVRVKLQRSAVASRTPGKGEGDKS
ncbi:MAG TPA: preprotein translocase subunit YajC [Myxococcota bacterium]|nr:preprotein translocase subunit YajC [Myxococcota bacterium]